MEHLTAFLTRMPKVELHVHLESTMPGEMLARFAARQGRELPRPAERLYDCSAEDLSDFLAFLDNICSFVGTPEELAEAAEHAALESWAGAYPVQRDDPEPHPLAPVHGAGDHRRGDR